MRHYRKLAHWSYFLLLKICETNELDFWKIARFKWICSDCAKKNRKFRTLKITKQKLRGQKFRVIYLLVGWVICKDSIKSSIQIRSFKGLEFGYFLAITRLLSILLIVFWHPRFKSEPKMNSFLLFISL